MSEQLDHIIKRIDTRHLSRLWLFYRDYFSSDSSCLQFLYDAFKHEPENDVVLRYMFATANDCDAEEDENKDESTINDSVFIPRRMVNTVERLVTAARDMEQIRRGKDIFKIVFIVTCVETLQNLSGNSLGKRCQLMNFFNTYTSEDDKNYISTHFIHDDEEIDSPKDDSFKQFIGVLNEYRNCATHEGEYWDICFHNNPDGYHTLIGLNINLENFSRNNKKAHSFQTAVSYSDFEAIFIRTCIRFIQDYISKKVMNGRLT